MTEKEIRIIRVLLGGLPICEAPYALVAERAGVSEEELLAQIASWQDDGTIRRFGAVLAHRRAGYRENALAVWNVPDEGVEGFARAAVEHEAVSHCYRRPRFDGFPYNMYTMLHGREPGECEEAAAEIAADTGVADFELLPTVREFKKSAPAYFSEEEA